MSGENGTVETKKSVFTFWEIGESANFVDESFGGLLVWTERREGFGEFLGEGGFALLGNRGGEMMEVVNKPIGASNG